MRVYLCAEPCSSAETGATKRQTHTHSTNRPLCSACVHTYAPLRFMIGDSSILYMGSPHKQPRHATKMMLKTTRTMRLRRRLQQILLLVVVGLVLVSTEASAEEEQTAQTQASYPPSFKYGATVCYACQPGNFSSSPGSPRCSRCMPGFYSKFPASSTCLPCQPSTFTPFMGSSSCLPCKGAQGFNFSTCPSTIIRRKLFFHHMRPHACSCLVPSCASFPLLLLLLLVVVVLVVP